MNIINNVCIRPTTTLADDFDTSITCEEYYMEDPIFSEIDALLDKIDRSLTRAEEAATRAKNHIDNAQKILDNLEQTNGTSETNRL